MGGMRVCKGLNTADSPNSDYETWTPSDGKSEERCLLGRHILYRRRKQLAERLNNKDLEWPRDTKNCTCTQENFECDEGFHRGIESMECVPEHPSDFFEDDDGRPGVCHNRDFYAIDAYRIVSGDSCTGGWVPAKYHLQCKEIREIALATTHRSRLISWSLFFKALAVVLGLAVVCCLSKSQTVRTCCQSLRIKLAGGKDYSTPSRAPPSAASDPTNIGLPS